MKSIVLAGLAGLVVAYALSDSANAQTAERARHATMPPTMIVEFGGSAPSMAAPTVHIGEITDPVTFVIEYAREGNQLGDANSARWLARDFSRSSDVSATLVVTGPSGQVWRSTPAIMSANRNGPGIITDGYKTLTMDDDISTLYAVLNSGGEFVFALEDQDGRIWGPTRSTLPSTAERQRLFETNLEGLRNQPPMVITPTSRRP